MADAGHVLDGAFRRHGAKSDHAGDMAYAILLFHVIVGFGQVFKIHVDIRHGDAVRIQETLEQELVLDGVQVGNPEAVGHDGPGGGASARPHHASHGAGGCNVVLNNKEIVRKTHPADGFELEINSFLLLLRQVFPVALMGAREGKMTQIRHRVAETVSAVIAMLVTAAGVYDILVLLQVFVYLGHEGRIYLIHRQHRIPVDGIALYLAGHLQGVFNGLRMVREQGEHLFLCLDILLLGIAQAGRVVYVSIGCEADQAVVHGAVFLAHKVRVIGCDDLDAVLLRQLEDFFRVVALLLVKLVGEAGNLRLVLHHLQVIVFPEHPFVPEDGLFHRVRILGQDGPGNFPGYAGAAADEALVVLLYYLVAHPGAVIHAVHMPLGHDFYQIQVPLVVLGQQDQVVVPLFFEPMVPFGHVNLTADDRLYVRVLLGILEELLHAVHITVVRDGQCGHPQLVGPVEKVFYGRLSVQDGVLGVDVKMHKTHRNKDTSFFPDSQKKTAGSVFAPALGLDGEFHAFRGDEHGARLRLGQVADDVESLEIPAEFLQIQDGHYEEEAVVVSAVHGRGNRVDVQLFPQLEAVALEGDFVGIDLGAQAAVPREAFERV